MVYNYVINNDDKNEFKIDSNLTFKKWNENLVAILKLDKRNEYRFDLDNSKLSIISDMEKYEEYLYFKSDEGKKALEKIGGKYKTNMNKKLKKAFSTKTEGYLEKDNNIHYYNGDDIYEISIKSYK